MSDYTIAQALNHLKPFADVLGSILNQDTRTKAEIEAEERYIKQTKELLGDEAAEEVTKRFNEKRQEANKGKHDVIRQAIIQIASEHGLTLAAAQGKSKGQGKASSGNRKAGRPKGSNPSPETIKAIEGRIDSLAGSFPKDGLALAEIKAEVIKDDEAISDQTLKKKLVDAGLKSGGRGPKAKWIKFKAK